MSLSSASPAKPEEYPKFLLKAESKLLGGNMTVAIADEQEGNLFLIVTIFDNTGTKHFDSFMVGVSEQIFKVAVQDGSLISKLEKMYLDIQVFKKSESPLFNKEGGASYAH